MQAQVIRAQDSWQYAPLAQDSGWLSAEQAASRLASALGFECTRAHKLCVDCARQQDARLGHSPQQHVCKQRPADARLCAADTSQRLVAQPLAMAGRGYATSTGALPSTLSSSVAIML